jgi:ABC-type multidrug transport system permease subunit
MLFLSGVCIPVSVLPPALRPVAYSMPLTYSIDSLKASFGHQPEIMHPAVSLFMLLIFSSVFLALSVNIMKLRISCAGI